MTCQIRHGDGGWESDGENMLILQLPLCCLFVAMAVSTLVQMHGTHVGKMDGWTDGWLAGWMDGQTDGWAQYHPRLLW